MKKILVVCDIQNDYISGPMANEHAKETVLAIKNKIKNFKGEILYLMDTRKSDYLDTQEGIMNPTPHCIENTDGWEICDDLQEEVYGSMEECCGCCEQCQSACESENQQTEYLAPIEKLGFGSLDLSYILLSIDEEEMIERIDFTGMNIETSILTNVLLAKTVLPNTPIFVETDCCSAKDSKAKDIAIAALKSCQVNII